MSAWRKDTSVLFVLVALILGIYWLPFCAGHPLVTGTLGILILLLAPVLCIVLLVVAWILWPRSKRRTRE